MDDDFMYLKFCERRQFALQAALQRADSRDTTEDVLEAAEAFIGFIEDHVRGPEFAETPTTVN